MSTRIDEIADGIFRVSTHVPEVAPPAGFDFNQFLVLAEEPLLFHTGQRQLFPAVSETVARVVPLERLRWIGFGHFEADECGAANLWLTAAPGAEIAHGDIACGVNLMDFAERPPRQLAHGEVLDLGGKRVRYLDTPHTPHGWDAGLMYEETTETLLCGDLFSQVGLSEPLVSGDIVGPAIHAEDMFKSSSLHPEMGATIRNLAQLAPKTLALMHGPSFAGDCAGSLEALAHDYDRRAWDWREMRAAAV